VGRVIVFSHGNVRVMEIGKGKAHYYNKQMNMGVILLNRDPGIIPLDW